MFLSSMNKDPFGWKIVDWVIGALLIVLGFIWVSQSKKETLGNPFYSLFFIFLTVFYFLVERGEDYKYKEGDP
jgi:hypothetical protein